MADGELDQYVGEYGPRTIRRDDSALVYQRLERDPMTMIPLGDDRFGLEELPWFRLSFERGEHGRVTRLVGLYENGRLDANELTGESLTHEISPRQEQGRHLSPFPEKLRLVGSVFR